MPAEAVDRRHALVAAVSEAEPGQALDLTDPLGTDWNRVVFLGSYSTNEETKEYFNLDFDVEAVSQWNNTEGGTIVVLAEGSEPVAWMAVDHSSEVALQCLDGMSIERADATLAVYEDSDGYRALRVVGDRCYLFEDVEPPASPS